MSVNDSSKQNYLYFDEISNMPSLCERIKNNEVYKEKLFVVTYVPCERKQEYNGRNYEKEKIVFGKRTNDYFRTNNVIITIYDDYVTLTDNQNGRIHDKYVSTKGMSEEDKIFCALNVWNSYYYD